MKRVFRFCFLLSLLALVSCSQKQTLRFLQFNIWQEGTIVEGGFEALADEIARADADFVMLSEVRNYHGTRFCDRLTRSLAERGKTYHSFYSYDSGLLSKYPIKDSTTIFPENGDHGSVYKLVAEVSGRDVAVYTAHLDYLNCAYYDVKGTDGQDWHRLETPLTEVDKILEKNTASQRDDAIRLFLEDAQGEVEEGSLVFLGGDLNEPSHLDWTREMKDSADHHGVVIPWTVSTLLYENGFVDGWRQLFPDPLTHPGYTCPCDNPNVPVSSLAWAPYADERERIDFIYFHPDAQLKVVDAHIIGPSGHIIRGERVGNHSQDPFIAPLGIWPTDHKAVLMEFEWKH